MSITPLNPKAYKGQALISLTYDDGDKTNFEVALPLHKAFNIRAGFAIIAKRTHDPDFWHRYMTANMVMEASEQGIEIYSHSYSHPRMTELDATAIEFEMQKSREVLEPLIDTRHQKSISAICIPYSKTNPAVMAAAEKHYAFIRVRGDKFTPKENGRTVFSFSVQKNTTFDDVKKIIDKAVREKAWVTLMLHGTVPQAKPDQRDYEIDANLLRQILAYIKNIGEEDLLPVNISDIARIRATSKTTASEEKPSSGSQWRAALRRLLPFQ